MSGGRNRSSRAAANKVISYTVLSSSDDESSQLEPKTKKRNTRQSSR